MSMRIENVELEFKLAGRLVGHRTIWNKILLLCNKDHSDEKQHCGKRTTLGEAMIEPDRSAIE